MTVRSLVAAALALAASTALAAPRVAIEKPGPQKSAFYDFRSLEGFSPGVGQIGARTCTVGSATQPAEYAGNMLLDCDGEVPHNETTIAVNPADPLHAVGGYHSYNLNFVGSTVVSHVVGTTSVTFDGGTTWKEVAPPITPYQFTGDPALAFGTNGRLWFANIADHEGPGGSYTAPSVVVATSDDGGLTWTNPVTVASGQGAITPGGVSGQNVFQDKEYIAADAFDGSPYAGRAYVTWTSFQERALPIGFLARAPIMSAWSQDGRTWSPPREISGYSPACSAAYQGRPNECDQNQASYPTVAPNGRVYVSFENFNTPAENQILAVSSGNGGRTFGDPVKVADVYDVNFPRAGGRNVLTGCRFRLLAVSNSAADPSDPTGRTVYVTWFDNRNGTATATNADVFLARSTDAGQTWRTYVVDGSANDQFYPWVAVAPDGRVDVGYMDRFASAGQGECKYGFSLARMRFDTQGSMSKSIRRVDTGLSHADASLWFADAAGQTSFIGDYNGVAVGPDGGTWSLWTDMRAAIPGLPPSRSHGQHAVGAYTAP